MNVLESEVVPGSPLVLVSLPFDGCGSARTTPRILHSYAHRLVVQSKFDVTAYPFDKQVIQLALVPSTSEIYPFFEYVANTDDPCVGIKLSSSTLNEELIGTKVSGFEVTDVDSNVVFENGKTQVKLEVNIRRLPSQPFFTYLFSALIIWMCSWALLFISVSIAPAAAVIAQVVLIMITNGCLSSVMGHLPNTGSLVYASAALLGSLIQQLFQLAFHLFLMSAEASKQDLLLGLLTPLGQAAFPALFLWVQGALVWAYFGLAGPAGPAFLIAALLASLALAAVVARQRRVFGELRAQPPRKAEPVPGQA